MLRMNEASLIDFHPVPFQLDTKESMELAYHQ